MTDYMSLLSRWADERISPRIEQVLEMLPRVVASPSYDFRSDLYPLLSAIDELIPGIGMQYTRWEGRTPRFPFAKECDAAVRPLSYVPYHLAALMSPSVMAREIANYAGAHVEQCVKGVVTRRDRRKPLGTLIRLPIVEKRIGSELCDGISQYVPSWNAAKHDYEGRGPESVITLEDAIRNYFVARSLGAAVLNATGLLRPAVLAIEEAANNRTYYRRGYLPEPTRPSLLATQPTLGC